MTLEDILFFPETVKKIMDSREERQCYCHGVFGSETLFFFLGLFYEGVPFAGIMWEEVFLDTFR